MSLYTTGAEAVRALRGAGIDAIREGVWHAALRISPKLTIDPVWEADWDLLVVLDACRADLYSEVVDEDDELPVGSSRISPGGTSTEWLEAVFDRSPAELGDVAYVTANPYSESHIDRQAFGHLQEVWRGGWDDELGTVPPRRVTEAAIQVGREADMDRLVVHYMQPHFPSVVTDTADGITVEAFGERSLSVWEDLRFGRRSRAEVWREYRANLERVLEDVRLLLRNVTADQAVITADHGNAFGERSIYGHATGLSLRPLREVPWAVTTATDSGQYQPSADQETESIDETEVEERLRDLGYR